MPKVPLVFCGRHGSTILNSSGCFRGRINVPLDDQGRNDAKQLGEFFKDKNIGSIVASDKLRSGETADIIGKALKLPVHKTPSLHAWNVGDFSGKPKNEENTNELEWYIHNPECCVPGGESLNEFKSRLRPCIHEAIHIANDFGKPMLLVVHSSVIHELGSMFHGNHMAKLVEPGGAALIYADDSGIKVDAILKARKTTPREADTVS